MNARSLLLPALAAAALAATGFVTLGRSAESVRLTPPPAVDEAKPSAPAKETAVIAGGCFWGVQGVFQHVKGVVNAVSGYAGGEKATAEYETVSTGETGHAESVRITFDPREISYGRILQIYFSVAHDPTELNRQGPDVGTQYRSAIFPQTADQAQHRQGLYRSDRRGQGVRRAAGDQDRTRPRLLPGGSLSPGLSDAAPRPAVHRVQRHPQDRGAQKDIP